MKIFGKRISLVLALVLAFSMVLNGLAFAADSSENKVQRIQGDNRYHTAAEIAKKQFGTADTVIVARGDDDFADGLAASVLAGAENAPILLTLPDRMHSSFEQGLKDLKVKKAILVGSEVAISAKVANAIKALGIEVDRVGGKNRFETALNIAKAAGVNTDTAYIVNGYAFADAMVAGAGAFQGKGVILPVLENKVPDITNDAIKQLGIKNATIVGSTAVVKEDVKKALENDGIKVNRLGGSDRERTSVEFAKGQFGDVDGLTVVNGRNGLADAVGAAVLGNPILYTLKDRTHDVVIDYVKGALSKNAKTAITIVGGETVVTNGVQNNLQQIVDEAQPKELKIESVSAINEKTVRVTFNQPIKDVDFTNFTVSGGLAVIKATLLADKKTVEVEVNNSFTKNQEYTLTASGITNLAGEVADDLTGTFTWSVDEGVVVSLTKTTLNKGEEASVIVKDKDGKEVRDAKIEITSFNENIVSVSSSKIKGEAEGSTDVTVKVTLPDGTVLTNTFKVTVKEVPEQVVNQGFTLVDDINGAPQNTVAFNNGPKTTSMFAGDSKVVAMYETKNGDPETAPVDFTDATVRSLTPIIATASIDDKLLTVDANAGQSGKASFEVTFKDKTKRTFSVDVKKEPALTDVSVDATTVKLSDEVKGNIDTEGVNIKTVTVTSIDQYGNAIEFGNKGKVTVTSNTDGLTITGEDDQTLTDNELTITGQQGKFKIKSKENKIVNGRVDVKYFKDKSDEKPTSTKTINVNVVDVDPNATPVSLDIVGAASEIDANANNIGLGVDKINYANAKVYTLDANGNRLEKVDSNSISVDLVGEDDWVEVANNNTLKFQDTADAITLLTKSDTVNVDVTANKITKRLAVQYKNSANIPASATVATNPVTVKLSEGDNDLTFEELIFGAIDPEQLIEDPDLSEFIAVKKAAKNGGYLYNKPLVTVRDASGNVIPTGANVYGLNSPKAVTPTETGNIWIDEEQTLGYSATDFNVDFSVANVVITGGGDVTTGTPPTLDNEIKVANAGDTVTFTLVIKSIYVSTGDKDANNLLKTPVTVNVTVTK